MPQKTKDRLIGWVEWAVKGITVAMFGIITSMYNKLNENQNEINNLKARVTVIESQMVGWDVLTRIERTLGLLAASGKGNESMSVVADVLKTERQARNGGKE
jgi:hypothetical protein